MRYLSLGFLFLVSCMPLDGTGDKVLSRSFFMGFSPWLYDATTEAQTWVYNKINAQGDINSQHLEEGVPWPEAYAGDPFPVAFQNEIQGRLDRTVPGQKTLLQISPLNLERNGLALYRGSSPNMALPNPWDTYALNSLQVKTAFVNYAKKMIELFDPDFLVLGVEANLLIRNNPTLWPAYVELHQSVYTALKLTHPELPLSVSFFCVPFFPQWSSPDNLTDQKAGLADLESSMDVVSFSVHPFISGLLAESFPGDYLDTLFSFTQKPVAVSESSYPAQVWQTSVAPILTFNGSQIKQEAFLSNLLDSCQRAGARFVIWFTVRDYDALWSGLLGSSEQALPWRDTGLYDESGNPRLGAQTWADRFNLKRHSQ